MTQRAELATVRDRPAVDALVTEYAVAVEDGGPAVLDFVCGGRYAFGMVRTYDGWRLSEVVAREKSRRLADRRAADVIN
ncbi:hypothetical protein N4P33_22065 [Streptomyces sp. 15-116A]|uniref:hypothetical protein n=1 Tax=Streptomyces sp. 15-116A TaxID=2259035 RepID=UPI0021B43AC4|nr:hypothetical protein [Streptomyces sp. 15-116A]MCT7354817.1 hypothetical protein [Streptomyces sp. 15-116A]